MGRRGLRQAAPSVGWAVPYALALVGLVAASGCADRSSEQLIVRDVWIREPVPGQMSTVAYLTIENHGARAAALTGVSTAVASPVELHTSRMSMSEAGEMMTMVRVDEVPIPPHGTVELRPGSYHVMLFDISASLETGVTVDLTLEFDNGQTRTVPARVGAAADVATGER